MTIVKAGNKPIGRFAQNRKYADDAAGGLLAGARRLEAEGRDQRIPQRQQGLHPARRAAHDPLRGISRIEWRTINGDPKRVGELRAGEQRAGVDIRGDLMDLHVGQTCSPTA